ncbi:conjugal transfer protein TraG N-terminal domain-containing protein [uncultured Brachyspira sp.]|uniref:conjugal transfer protein TraG N-terminal domain-containing protein n=1 Tax=uncultured Brachyspira sp. TaxID=221953 RepID=UPI00262AA5AD|nr:conjugal transfer protein TraG N-terminal domain-containing protein [uncultured Brachyspira sp.]
MKRIFILTLLIVLLIPAFSYAQYTVYTWGYQDIMVSMLEAVKYFMGTKSFGDMFKIAMLLSMFTIFLSLLSDKGFSPVLIFQKVILVIALQTFLISPFSQMDLDIVDVSGNGALTPNGVAERVEKVPGIVGYPLYMLSSLEYGVREAFRASLNFGGLRVGAQYLDGMSIITALNLYQSTTNVRINNPDFTRSYQSFVENCVLPDMVSGYLDVRAVATSTNLWQLFGQDPHRARIGSFYMDYSQDWGPDGQILTCDQLYRAIDAQFATVSAEAENQLKAGLGLSAGIQLDQMIGAVNTAIVGFQQAQSNVLTNSMAINTFNDSYENIANGMGMDTTGLAYSMAKAQETARMNASMQGIMAKKYMPIAKGYLTVIFVAVIPLVIIVALVTSSFKKPFAMIFGMLLALALWNVGDQLLDFIIIVRTKALFALSGMSGYNMESQPFINSIITDTLNLSLGMYWMIPTLAFSIATLSGFGAASMMGSIAGTATAGVSGAAAEAASGSMSMGNIRMSNINMNKYDAAQTMNAGTSTKMSMDYQQTASNQSSVSTGTRNIHDDADSLKHEGTTFMRNQDGELLRMTGNFEQTGGAWKFSGNVQNLSTGETYTGNMSGMAKDMNSMQQGLNVDDVSMTGKERANLGDVKGENVAFIQGTVVDSNLSASDIIHKDKTRTENTTDEKNYSYERTTDIDTSRTEKHNNTYENKYVEDSSTTKNKSYTENDSKNIVSGTKTSVGDTVNDYTGAINLVNDGITKYGAHQGSMREALVDNMTKYQNSIMSEKGQDSVSLNKAWDIAMGADASVGVKVFGGTGVTASVQADLKSATSKNTSEISAADLNRVMNEAIFKGLDADAKANNWTAEQYDQAARERFGAYNDYLKEQAGKSFGPSDSDLAPIEKAEELEAKADKVIKKVTG